MKLVTCREGAVTRIGAVLDTRVVSLAGVLAKLLAKAQSSATEHAACDMARLCALDGPALAASRAAVDEVVASGALDAHPRLSDVTLLAPLPRPGKILAVGRNYADHAAETGVKPFEKPRIIAKLSSSVVGPGSVVTRPSGVVKLDYEIELAVVIGRACRDVGRDAALAHVLGYTIVNDVSAREFQFDVSPAQTTFAKSMDGFCPMGPWLVTPDELGDPQGVGLRLSVNGERLQEGNTRDMLFDVASLVAYLSGYMTLEPGDIIATGTPAGIGAFRTPPRWLVPGDRVTLEIGRIGRLEHTIG